jgi:hypothetical protein
LRPIAPGKVSRPLPPWDVCFFGSFFYARRELNHDGTT